MENTITTQNGLDALPLDTRGYINITGNIETFNHEFKNAFVCVSDNAVIINHNGGTIDYVSDNAVIKNNNGGIIRTVYSEAVIENKNGGWINSVRGNAVIINHNGGTIHYVSDNVVIKKHNGGIICTVYSEAVIENKNGGWINSVRGNAVIKNHNGGWIYSVYGNVVIKNHNGGTIYHKINETNIKINNNGGTVIAIQPCDNTFEWFKNSFPVETSGEYVTLYKAVRKRDGKYYSIHNKKNEYIIGEEKTEKVDTDVNIDCSFGIHLSHKVWAILFGSNWYDLAILELKVLISDIIVPTKCNGKVRTSKATVVREVPQTEWYN